MGGAQPLSVTLNGGVALAVDVDRSRIQRRVDTRYCDTVTEDLDEALRLMRSCAPRRPRIVCGPGRELRRCAARDRAPWRARRRGHRPDQRPRSVEWLHPSRARHSTQATELRRRDPEEYVRRSTASMVVHVNAMLALQRAGASPSTTATTFAALPSMRAVPMRF